MPGLGRDVVIDHVPLPWCGASRRQHATGRSGLECSACHNRRAHGRGSEYFGHRVSQGLPPPRSCRCALASPARRSRYAAPGFWCSYRRRPRQLAPDIRRHRPLPGKTNRLAPQPGVRALPRLRAGSSPLSGIGGSRVQFGTESSQPQPDPVAGHFRCVWRDGCPILVR